jgi:hypothetical protein
VPATPSLSAASMVEAPNGYWTRIADREGWPTTSESDHKPAGLTGWKSAG